MDPSNPLSWLADGMHPSQPREPSEISQSSLYLSPSSQAPNASYYSMAQSQREMPSSSSFSLPQPWLPPESPNTPRLLCDRSLSSHAFDFHEQSNRPEHPVYLGVGVPPGQRESLTSYGRIRPSSEESANPVRGVRTLEELLGLPQVPMAELTRQHPMDIPQRQGEAGISRPIDGNESTIARSTFRELAAQGGVEPWNNATFDDRWLLRSDELWTRNPPNTSQTLYPKEPHRDTSMHGRSPSSFAPLPRASRSSPSEPPQTFAAAALNQDGPNQDEQNFLSYNRGVLILRPIGDRGVGNRFVRHPAQGVTSFAFNEDPLGSYAALVGVGKSDPSKYLLPLSIPETENLEEVFRELLDQNHTLPSVYPFPPELVRSYFHHRIFGCYDGTHALSDVEAAALASWKGSVVSRQVLRREIVKVIDSMVEDMTCPLGVGPETNGDNGLLRPRRPMRMASGYGDLNYSGLTYGSSFRSTLSASQSRLRVQQKILRELARTASIRGGGQPPADSRMGQYVPINPDVHTSSVAADNQSQSQLIKSQNILGTHMSTNMNARQSMVNLTVKQDRFGTFRAQSSTTVGGSRRQDILARSHDVLNKLSAVTSASSGNHQPRNQSTRIHGTRNFTDTLRVRRLRHLPAQAIMAQPQEHSAPANSVGSRDDPAPTNIVRAPGDLIQNSALRSHNTSLNVNTEESRHNADRLAVQLSVNRSTPLNQSSLAELQRSCDPQPVQIPTQVQSGTPHNFQRLQMPMQESNGVQQGLHPAQIPMLDGFQHGPQYPQIPTQVHSVLQHSFQPAQMSTRSGFQYDPQAAQMLAQVRNGVQHDPQPAQIPTQSEYRQAHQNRYPPAQAQNGFQYGPEAAFTNFSHQPIQYHQPANHTFFVPYPFDTTAFSRQLPLNMGLKPVWHVGFWPDGQARFELPPGLPDTRFQGVQQRPCLPSRAHYMQSLPTHSTPTPFVCPQGAPIYPTPFPFQPQNQFFFPPNHSMDAAQRLVASTRRNWAIQELQRSMGWDNEQNVASSQSFLPQTLETRSLTWQPYAVPSVPGPAFAPIIGVQEPPASRVLPPIRLLPYRYGSDDMYPHAGDGPSQVLNDLVSNGRPLLDKLMNEATLPFADNVTEVKEAPWGVMRISNIPYSLHRDEVWRLLDRSARVVTPDLGGAIHIIMDRFTGKTMDCFVEFISDADVQVTVNRLAKRRQFLKLGAPPAERVVTVVMSSQEELMKQIFPRAKSVAWTGGKPTVQESEEPFNSGFKSFLSAEELVMMVKHAEQPHRSTYTQRCPQRVYEFMTSILGKFPWYAVNDYTLGQRNHIYSATCDLLRHLAASIKRGDVPNLNEGILFELMNAGLNAPGFSEKQRWQLIQAAGFTGNEIRISPLAKWWPWEALGRKVKAEEDVIEHYAYLFRLHPRSQAASLTTSYDAENPFGYAVIPVNPDLTMAAALAQEWEQLKQILADVTHLPEK